MCWNEPSLKCWCVFERHKKYSRFLWVIYNHQYKKAVLTWAHWEFPTELWGNNVSSNKTNLHRRRDKPIQRLSGETLSSIPSLLPLSRMWGSSSSSSSSLAPALKIFRLLTDPLQLHSRRKHQGFLCLVNKMHQHPGKCDKQQSWLGARGPSGGSGQSTHPLWAMWCEQGARMLSQGSLSWLREWVRKGQGQGTEWRNCYITLSKQLSSQSFTYFFSRWALRSLAVVIQDIPVPLWTGTNLLHAWQREEVTVFQMQ